MLFADDLVIYAASQSVDTIVQQLKDSLVALLDWCSTNKLIINFSKTKWILFSKTNKTKICTPVLSVYNQVIEYVMSFKYLGIWMDESFSFSTHYEHVFNKLCSTSVWIFKLKRLINHSLFKSILHAFILSLVDYCLPIWGNMHNKFLDKMQSKINQLLLAYYEPSFFKKHNKPTIVNSLLDKVGILTVRERYKYYILDFTFKTLKFSSNVDDIKTFFEFSQSSRRQLLKTITHSSKLFEKSIVYQGIKLWNALPVELRDINLSLLSFQRYLTNYLRDSRDDIYVA